MEETTMITNENEVAVASGIGTGTAMVIGGAVTLATIAAVRGIQKLIVKIKAKKSAKTTKGDIECDDYVDTEEEKEN